MKKQKRQTPLTTWRKRTLTVGANVKGEKFSQGRSLVADSESTSQQTTNNQNHNQYSRGR